MYSQIDGWHLINKVSSLFPKTASVKEKNVTKIKTGFLFRFPPPGTKICRVNCRKKTCLDFAGLGSFFFCRNENSDRPKHQNFCFPAFPPRHTWPHFDCQLLQGERRRFYFELHKEKRGPATYLHAYICSYSFPSLIALQMFHATGKLHCVSD